MKKKLLLITLPILLLTLTVQAQTKIWDFGGDSNYTSSEQIALWPIVDFNAAEGQTVEKDNLFLVGDSSGDKFGQIENSGGKTWDEGTADEYTAINRFKFNGGSSPVGFMPSFSYLYFPVTGAVDIKVWFRSGSSSADRTLYISDGTELLSSFDAIVDNTDPETLVASYTGAGGNIYIYDSNSFNLYKIEVTGPGAADLLLSNNDVASLVSTNLKAIGNRIYVSNVKSSTDIKIYSITGALVKSLSTNNNMEFDFKSGLYIATIETFEGKKSVKILTH